MSSIVDWVVCPTKWTHRWKYCFLSCKEKSNVWKPPSVRNTPRNYFWWFYVFFLCNSSVFLCRSTRDWTIHTRRFRKNVETTIKRYTIRNWQSIKHIRCIGLNVANANHIVGNVPKSADFNEMFHVYYIIKIECFT